MTDPASCTDERRYRVIASRDPRFDGIFWTGVHSTGIYCRPSCPARTPSRGNVRFYLSVAAAQGAGLRACRRCRPDAAPGSPAWDLRADLAGRAMRLIRDGVVEREGVPGLARRLGYSERQVHRTLHAHLGAGPLALARARRAELARLLAESTDLPFAAVGQAAGFASVRQFNDTIHAVYASTPGELRRRAGRTPRPLDPGSVEVSLPYREPMDHAAMHAFLAAGAVPGLEIVTADSYLRRLRLPRGPGIVQVRLGQASPGRISARIGVHDLRDLPVAVERLRRLLDLDADPIAVAQVLERDPLMAPLVARHPGLRVPGQVDGDELAVRAVLGQQVSGVGTRRLLTRLVEAHGELVDEAPGGSSWPPELAALRLFPTPATLAALDPAALPMPRTRARALVGVCTELAAGRIRLDRGADREATVEALLALPGIGPWTAGTVAARALGDPDATLPGDVGVRQALMRLGMPAGRREIEARFADWAPWRAYALMHLWTSLGHEPLPQDRSLLDHALPED